MENSKSSNKSLNEILTRLQECLNEFKCKSEIKVSEHEAILYGKLPIYMDRYTVVINIKEENHVAIAEGAGHYKAAEEVHAAIIPNLNLQLNQSQKANCSPEEQIKLSEKFREAAEQAGKDFLRNMDK